MVFVFRGSNDDLLDLKLLPYLLGFRVGMTTDSVTSNGAFCVRAKLLPQSGQSGDLAIDCWGDW